MGLAMGLTAIGIIYRRGKQSGAHLNPAVTLHFSVWQGRAVMRCFTSSRNLRPGVAGVALVAAAAGQLTRPSVPSTRCHAAGTGGPGAAFLGEVCHLLHSNVRCAHRFDTQRFACFTGLLAGACVAAFIIF